MRRRLLYKEKKVEEIISLILEKYKDDKSITKEEILSCIDDIKELENEGSLFSKDIYEDIAKNFKKFLVSFVAKYKYLC